MSGTGVTDWTKSMALDTMVVHGGKQSLKVLQTSTFSQSYLSVPVTSAFWFRTYIQTDLAVNGMPHDAFLDIDWSGVMRGIEVVEEYCQLGININDQRWGSDGTHNEGSCPTTGMAQLKANTWYCLEGFFDGTKGAMQLYLDGMKVFDQTGVADATHPLSAFKFGYTDYNGRNRNVWYDDVAVGPNQLHCQ